MPSNLGGTPLVFLLAMAAEAGAATMPEPHEAAALQPGSLAPLMRSAPGLAPDGAPLMGSPGRMVVPTDRTAQWYNWPNWNNWFNCYNGMWRNC